MASLFKAIGGIFPCLLGLLGILLQVQAQGAPLKITMSESSPVVAEKGSSLNMTCQINRGLYVILSHHIVWQKESHVPGLTNQVLNISKQQNLLVGFPLNMRYDVTIKYHSDSFNATLQIRNVSAGDDGRYICKATPIQAPMVIARGEIDVIVPNPAESVSLKVDGKGARVSSTKVAVGSHRAECLSERSYPEGQVRLKLDHQLVTPDQTNSSLMLEVSTAAGAPRYSVQMEADLELSQMDIGKRLSCEAVDSPIDPSVLVVVAKPSVHCDDVKVNRIRLDVTLVCMVTHVNVTLEDFLWELSNSSMEYSKEEPTHSTENVNDGKTQVSLRLDILKWGRNRTQFTLTAVTEVGTVSESAFLILVSDHEEDEDHDHDHEHDNDKEGGNEGKRNAAPAGHPPKKIYNHIPLLLLLLMMLLTKNLALF